MNVFHELNKLFVDFKVKCLISWKTSRKSILIAIYIILTYTEKGFFELIETFQ